MLIARIEGATRTLGKPEDMTDEQCKPLSIKDEMWDGVPVMISAWEPSPAEINALLSGAKVHLYIFGHAHPPVYVGVGA